MVRIGIVGIGFMGYTHFTAAQKLRGGRITAIATRNEKKLKGNWRGIRGNFGPPAGQVDLDKVTGYRDYRELIDDPEVDLVDICLPTDMHEEVALAALAAGKHVLVEKPIALEVKAAERMLRAAEKAGKLLMVAHVLPFHPEFKFAAEAVSSGKYGRLQAAHFQRVICQPNWSEEMSDFRKLGGWGIDLHIHDNHFISHLCGVPQKVFSSGMLQDGLVNHVHSQYLFENSDAAVSCVSGGIAQSGLQFAHAFELYLEKATLLFSAGTIAQQWVVDRPLTLMTDNGRTRHPPLKGGAEWYSAFTSELQAAVNGVKSGQAPPLLSGDLATAALKICHAEAKSIESGRAVKV